jgi:DNA-binding GntR family transcriptional regulator
LAFELDIGQTLAVRTAEAIRARILEMTPGYAPGQRLMPDALADALGVSITPVREALRALSAEGLVDLLPRRGARVATMTTKEIADLSVVRGGIEALAVRVRGENYSASEISELTTCLDECEQAITTRDAPTYRHFDSRLHWLIVAGSQSPTLVGIYEQLGRRAQILGLYYSDDWNPYVESLREHREIVRSLSGAPLTEIEAMLWSHWQHSSARIIGRFGDLAQRSEEGRVTAAVRRHHGVSG